MSEIPSTTDQLDEQLTAYLDGELPPAEARRMEDLLAGDERARKRLNQLASSWDLLDQLPRAAVDENFTRTTVEMVALSTEEEIAQTKTAEPSKRRNRLLAAAVIALLAAGVGFTAVSVATPNNNDALLRDLPVVVNLEQYRPVGSIDLLRELNQTKIFTGDPPPSFRPRQGFPPGDRNEARKDARNETRSEPEKTLITVPESSEDRRNWVAKQTAEEKLDLRRNFERFSALLPQEQKSLAELDRELKTADDRDQLVSIMRRYNDWLRRDLSPADRGTLEDLSAKKKVAWIEQRRHEHESWALFGVRGIQAYAKQHEDQLLLPLTPETKAILQKVKEDDAQSRGPQRNRYYSRLVLEAWRTPNVELPAITSEDLQPLINHIKQLPPESALRERLKGKTDAADIVAALRESVQSGSFYREMAPRGGGGWWQGRRRNFDWAEFEASLTPEEKKKLEDVPRDQRQEKLIQIWRARGGDRTRFGPDSFRGPGDGPPPGGFGGEDQRPNGQRRNGQPREGSPRGGDGPRRDRDRNGPNGPPRDFGPGDNGEGRLPPPDDERRPERRPPEN